MYIIHQQMPLCSLQLLSLKVTIKLSGAMFPLVMNAMEQELLFLLESSQIMN